MAAATMCAALRDGAIPAGVGADVESYFPMLPQMMGWK
jgi:hypothetical protein